MEDNRQEKKMLTGQTKDAVILQEQIEVPLYEKIIDDLSIGYNVSLLDVGCGSGLFCRHAFAKGANVTGIDNDVNLVNTAKLRVPSEKFVLGDMSNLPFADNSFGIVSFIQSLSFAANQLEVLREAKRVLQLDGVLVIATWGNDASGALPSYFKTIEQFYSDNRKENNHLVHSQFGVVETLLKETGFLAVRQENFSAISTYTDPDAVMNTILSSSPARDAIDQAGYSRVFDAVYKDLLPFQQPDKSFRIENHFQIFYAKQQ